MTQTSRRELPTDCIYPQRGGRMVLVDIATLCALLPDWIKQNTENADSFRQWAARSIEIGLAESAQRIEEAADQMAACNRALDAALESLKEVR